MLLGYLIGVAIVSLIGGLLLKLSAKLIAQKTVNFGACFIVSFVSFLLAFFTQDLVADRRLESSFADILPGIVFFVSCWLLNGQFIKYGEENNRTSFSKAFLVTGVQCVGLFIILLIFGIVLIGILYQGNLAAK